LGRNRAGLIAAALLASAAAPAWANQEPRETDRSVEGARVYLPEDFARFAPRNAHDMVRQIPGFSIQRESQARGLGQASGNVLVNGQRISGKSNDAVTELGRIPAGSVVRIEVVDGSTLNIAGLSGQVANVIVEAAGISGQFQWRGEARARNTRPLFTNGSASISGASGPLAFTLGLRNEAFRAGNAGPAEIFDASGALIDLRQERALFSGDRPRVSAGIKYDGPGGAVGNLNLGYERYYFNLRETSDRRGPGQPDRFRTLSTTEREHNYEISGDYELGLAGGRLKLIGLHQFERSPIDTRLVTTFADGSPAAGSRFFRVGDETETVGRAEYRWRGGASDWQLSAEAAFNSLDNVSHLYTLLPDGSQAELPLPGGTARVTEDRYEGALTWGRPLSPSLALQASLGAEHSTLSQTGPLGLTRAFFRPKGFVTAAWKASPRLDVNARLERRVGQLNFFDFLASENLGRESGDAANPDLVPPQSWEAEVEAARNLGPWGTTRVRAYAHLIEDIIDQIPIGLTGESPGNLDQAVLVGGEWKSTFQLAPLGWTGARLDARLQFQTSRLADPLTGDPRRISNDLLRVVDFNLRHDVPGTDWAWGGQLSQQRRSASVRLGEISRNFELSPFMAAMFVEHKDVAGLTVRASFRNLLGANDYFERIVSTGRRGSPVAFLETRNRSVGPVFALTVSGTL
jgi:outer membrane receptor for ferrienterochelin and colicins